MQGSLQDSQRTSRAMFYVLAIFFLITTLFPFYWLLVVALTPETPLSNIGLLPNGFNPGAFVEMFERLPFHIYMFNTFMIALSATVVVLVLGSLAGYVFGRLTFPGRGPLMLVLLAVSFFPPVGFIVPLFQLFVGNVEVFGITSPMLFNSPFAIMLPAGALYMPLAIFILMTFYRQIPDELEDTARVKGSTRLGALFRVIIPLSAPGVATAGVLTFIYVYNEFFVSF